LQLLRASLTQHSKHVYFAQGYDMTRSCQRQRQHTDAPGTADRRDCDRDGDGAATTSVHRDAPSPDSRALKNNRETAAASERGARGGSTMWRSADKSFCWNRHAGKTLVAAADVAADVATAAADVGGTSTVESLLTPLMYGSFATASATHLGTEVSITILARTSIARVGIRHHCRGSDARGEVANFVETEQIVQVDGKRGASSFVIVRGSVPLRWSQPLRNFFWKYRIFMTGTGNEEVESEAPVDAEAEAEAHVEGVEAATPLRRHFSALGVRYGRVTVVDLLSCHGDEARLRLAFANAVSQLPLTADRDLSPSLRYVQYDFSRESRGAGGNVAALGTLVTSLGGELRAHGHFVDPFNPGEHYTAATARSTRCAVRQQEGVFRVNCKDCLDRTNLVQAGVAHAALEQQLHSLGALGQEECLSAALDAAHRHLWSDHGDAVSTQYSGTVVRIPHLHPKPATPNPQPLTPQP